MTRTPTLRLYPQELIVDNFAGGGVSEQPARAAAAKLPNEESA